MRALWSSLRVRYAKVLGREENDKLPRHLYEWSDRLEQGCGTGRCRMREGAAYMGFHFVFGR